MVLRFNIMMRVGMLQQMHQIGNINQMLALEVCLEVLLVPGQAVAGIQRRLNFQILCLKI